MDLLQKSLSCPLLPIATMQSIAIREIKYDIFAKAHRYHYTPACFSHSERLRILKFVRKQDSKAGLESKSLNSERMRSQYFVTPLISDMCATEVYNGAESGF